jgi:hypothetical protein
VSPLLAASSYTHLNIKAPYEPAPKGSDVMRWFTWNAWDALAPSTAFFGQGLAVLVTYNDNALGPDALPHERATTYLPVFFRL